MIYALVGTEPFLVDRAFVRLRGKLWAGLSEFDHDLFFAGTTSVETILSSLRQLPFLGRRLVIVKEVEKWKSEDCERLEEVVTDFPSSLEWLLVGGKIDKRLRFWRLVGEKGKMTEYRPLYPREVPGWIREELKERGVTLAAEALASLTGLVGCDVGIIVATLERLLLSLGERRHLTLADVEKNVTSFSWKNLFELAEAVGSRKKEEALRLSRAMLEGGESPVGLLALIVRHLRILMKLKSSPRLSAPEVGVPPFFLSNYLQQASQFTEEELREKYDLLYRTDRALKSSPLPPESVFERAIWELCC